MAEQDKDNDLSEQGGPSTPVKPRSRRQPQKNPPKLLPQWKVLLHNDDVNAVEDVIRVIRQLTVLTQDEAKERTTEADQSGCALLLMTHRERAELYVEQFASMGLTATCEPDA